MAASTGTSVRVDIVSDVVCPWCVIGYYQLAAAARQMGIAVEVDWHPFELNPHMAPEGENLREHLAAKYGTTSEGSRRARARHSLRARAPRERRAGRGDVRPNPRAACRPRGCLTGSGQ